MQVAPWHSNSMIDVDEFVGYFEKPITKEKDKKKKQNK
jgi:hypothetical protein